MNDIQSTLQRDILLGQNPTTRPRLLRAGPLTLLYEGGDIRYLRLGETEVMRRIYAAVRDRNWSTVPLQLSDEIIEDNDNSFRVSFKAAHRQNEIDFVWNGQICGDKDGTVRFDFDGEAQSTFGRNRIGFCVLHPLSAAGARCRVQHFSGKSTDGHLPQLIAPDSPFTDIQNIAHEVQPSVWCQVAFEGDVFEMEDQRNWTDASFKTYCTPLRYPYPVEIAAGTRISQLVTLRLSPKVLWEQVQPIVGNDKPPKVVISIENEVCAAMPPLGLGVASHDELLSGIAIERLKTLHLAHLRVDLRLNAPDFVAPLQHAAVQSAALGIALEVALFVSDDANVARGELLFLREQLSLLRPNIASWLMFTRNNLPCSAQTLKVAREVLTELAPEALFGTGSNANFTELNRNRPTLEGVDFVAYAANPQVHAFDNASLVETCEALPHTVESAHAFCSTLPIVISPLTLKPRFNAVATGPIRETAPEELPDAVDARQSSLFGAAWTIGALASLACSGLSRLTFYETTGWRGVMERAGGSPSSAFHSVAGGVFPLYHVLADVGEWAESDVLKLTSSDGLRATGLALRQSTLTRVIVANLSAQEQEVEVRGVGETVRVKMLDESNAENAMREPEKFRREVGRELRSESGAISLRLRPCAVVRLDYETPSQ